MINEYFVQLLIRAGAHLNMQIIGMSETALHIVAHYNKVAIANLLISAGADLTIMG